MIRLDRFDDCYPSTGNRGCLLIPLITKVMKLSTTLFFATAALATASELDNLGPEWEPVDIADGTEVANAHRALGGEYKLLSCRKKCDGSNKGREIKICEYLVDGKYEVKKWEYWSKRSVCWGGTDRDPWSSSSSSSDSCRKEKKECKRKCDRRLLEEGIAEEVRTSQYTCYASVLCLSNVIGRCCIFIHVYRCPLHEITSSQL